MLGRALAESGLLPGKVLQVGWGVVCLYTIACVPNKHLPFAASTACSCTDLAMQVATFVLLILRYDVIPETEQHLFANKRNKFKARGQGLNLCPGRPMVQM